MNTTLPQHQEIGTGLYHTIHTLADTARVPRDAAPRTCALALLDVATVLLCEYFRTYADDQDWAAQDQFSVSADNQLLLLDAFLCAIGHTSIEGVANTEYAHTVVATRWQRKDAHFFARAIGTAYAYRFWCDRHNTDNWKLCSNDQYVVVDAHLLLLAYSLDVVEYAGRFGLSNVTVIAYVEDGAIDSRVVDTYTAYEWQVISPIDGHSIDDISQAFNAARANSIQPSLLLFQCSSKKVTETYQPTSQPPVLPLDGLVTHHTRLYQAWQTRFALYEEQHPDMAYALVHPTQREKETEFAATSLALAEDMQESETSYAIDDGCLLAIQLLIEPLASAIVVLHNQYAINRYCDNRHELPNNIVKLQYSDSHRDLYSGIASTALFTPISVATIDEISDMIPHLIRSICDKIKTIHCLLTSSDVLERPEVAVALDACMSLEHVSVWRPCDIVEAIVAVQQSLLVGDALILADSFTPVKYQRDIDDMERMVTGGYCLFDSRNPQGKYNTSVPLVFFAQGAEVATALKQAKAYQGHAQVWSLPSPSRFFSDLPTEQFENTERAVVCHSLYWKLCAHHIGADKAITLDEFVATQEAQARTGVTHE